MGERWDEEYRQGAHWEAGPSSQVKIFAKLLKPGEKIFDAGSGSGRDSLFLAKLGFKVTGVDISKVGVEKARNVAKKKKLAINFFVGDLENLKLRDEEFDGVYSGYVLENTDITKSIPELARVLKSGHIAYLVIFESTHYNPSTKYDLNLSRDNILRVVKASFKIIELKEDEYEESDQHGKHRHKRMILICKK